MRTPRSSPAHAWLALCVGVLALAASAPGHAQCTLNSDCPPNEYCEKVEGDCDGVGTCAERPGGCPPVWDPVCGCDGQTHGNWCEAAAVGVNVAYQGECGTLCFSTVDCDPDEYCWYEVCAIETGVCRTRPTACDDLWEPVCDCNGDSHQSPCHAAFAGQSVDTVGACADDVCNDNGECIPEEYCAKADGDCTGQGACMPRPDPCPLVWDPICGCDGATWSNKCVAAMEGVNVQFQGECEAACQTNDECAPEQYCLKTPADCDGEGRCTDRPLDCPAVYDPVCGCDRVSYDNDCFAGMAGVSVFYPGLCTWACRGTVAAPSAGWRAAALPLSLDNDDETPPFPVLTTIPGGASDDIASSAALVLYRVLRDDGQPAACVLRAVKTAGGVELDY